MLIIMAVRVERIIAKFDQAYCVPEFMTFFTLRSDIPHWGNPRLGYMLHIEDKHELSTPNLVLAATSFLNLRIVDCDTWNTLSNS